MARRWQVPTVSVGETLRREIAAGSLAGQEAARFLDHGQLVPDKLAIATIDRWLELQPEKAFVADGFPRTLGQAEALETMLGRRKSPLTAALWLDLDEDRVAERISKRLTCADCGATFRLGSHVQGREEACPECGGTLTTRGDDGSGALAERMLAYRERTEPVAAFYDRRGLLRRIDAGGTPDEVFARIEAAVASSRPEPAEAAAGV